MKFSRVNECPRCKSEDTKTYHMNHKWGSNHRTRMCNDCGHKWSTVEITEVEFDKLCDTIEEEVRTRIKQEIVKKLKKAIDEMEF